MSDLRELLREAAFVPERGPDFEGLLRRVQRRRRRRAVATATALSALSVGLAALLIVPFGDDGTITMVTPSSIHETTLQALPTSAAPTTVPAETSIAPTTAHVETSIAPTTPHVETSIAPTTAHVETSIASVITAAVPHATTPTSEATATTTARTTTTTTAPTSATTSAAPGASAGTRRVTVRIVGANGVPFPKDTTIGQACPTNGDECAFSQNVDGFGTVTFDIDPAVTYIFSAMVRDTGWPGGYVSPTGVIFHFSEAIVATGADLADGTVFVIEPP